MSALGAVLVYVLTLVVGFFVGFFAGSAICAYLGWPKWPK